jgi:phospholipid/cholesterol/gamma-HCH transport system substrate-binding protein
MMETRAHHILIGLFTVIVVAAALLFGLWLAKSSVDTAFKDYQVVFNEAVTGLSRGSPVQYSGIKVGDVVQLRLDPQDPRRVLAQIRVAGETPIKRDTFAKLALNGITGTSIIQLSGGTPQSEELKGDDGNLPVIIASPSPISRLLNDSNDLITGINVFLHNANELLSSKNVQALSNTMEHLEQTTAVIADQRDDIRQTLKQLLVLSKQASATLDQTSTAMRNANLLFTVDGKQAIATGQAAMVSLQQSTDTINQLIRANKDSVDGGLQGLSELGPAIRELRETLTSLKTISRSLNANPSGYLLGSDKNKEFQP